MKSQILSLALCLFLGTALQAQSEEPSEPKVEAKPKVELTTTQKEAPKAKSCCSADKPAELGAKAAKSCCSDKKSAEAGQTKKSAQGASCCASKAAKTAEATGEKTVKATGCSTQKEGKLCCSTKSSAKKA